jgi:hypothetical protein
MYKKLYFETPSPALPTTDVKSLRDACIELHTKHYTLSVISEPNIEKYVVLKPNYLCNYISSTVYALSSINFLRQIVKQIYLQELKNIDQYGTGAWPKYIFRFVRLMFHIKRQTLKGEYFKEFVESIHSNLPGYMTYSFVDIYAFIVDFIASIHYRMKYLKFFDLDERNNPETHGLTKFELFSNEF